MSDMMKNTLQKSKDEGIAEGLAKGRAEGEARGRAEGEAKEKDSFAVRMLNAKEPVAKIIEYTQLTIEQIQAIAKSIGVAVVM